MCLERVENLKVECGKLEIEYSKDILRADELNKQKRDADQLQIKLQEEIQK